MNLKTCAACKTVKYCSLACQKRHRPSHKKECRARAAQLFDEGLFEQPPPAEDCAICFLQLPYDGGEINSQYQSCCGKSLCHGCMHGVRFGNDLCPFCRKPTTNTHDDENQRCTKRMKAGDAEAFMTMGMRYLLGQFGLAQDMDRGFELLLRAAELGSAKAHYNLAVFYTNGQHVPRNTKKAVFHNQQAAMGGHMKARHNLGFDEMELCKWDRAIKHWMIAAASGDKLSLSKMQFVFTQGHATKAQYESALRAYQSYQEETQSDQRTRSLDFLQAHNLMDDEHP